jgi:hypothetical protein
LATVAVVAVFRRRTVLFSVMGGPPTADGTVPPEVVAIFETID